MNKRALAGSTGYAPVAGAEFPMFTHATDDHGFPLCACDPCRAKSKAMNDAFIESLFSAPWRGPDVDKQREIESGADYEVMPDQHGSGS